MHIAGLLTSSQTPADICVPLPTFMLSPMLHSHLVHLFHNFIVYKQYKLEGSTLCPPSLRSGHPTPPVYGCHYSLLFVFTFSVPGLRIREVG